MAKNWYAIHIYSGFEEKVKSSIEEKIKLKGLEDKITKILVPTEKVVELKDKKKKKVEKKFYPGYILVEMELDDEAWYLIKNIPQVVGFIGGIKPVPLIEEEIEVIFQQLEKEPAPLISSHFEKGKSVKIIDGPFSNFTGYIDELDMSHGRLRVMVSIFGRQTPVELSFAQVEKA